MTRLAAFLLGTAVLTTAARAEPPLKFERNGIAYVATVTTLGGVQQITGHEVESGRAFALRVDRGSVTGIYDGQSVAYSLAKTVRQPEQTASR